MNNRFDCVGFTKVYWQGKDILENGRFVKSKQSQDSAIELEVLREKAIFKREGFPPYPLFLNMELFVRPANMSWDPALEKDG